MSSRPPILNNSSQHGNRIGSADFGKKIGDMNDPTIRKVGTTGTLFHPKVMSDQEIALMRKKEQDYLTSPQAAIDDQNRINIQKQIDLRPSQDAAWAAAQKQDKIDHPQGFTKLPGDRVDRYKSDIWDNFFRENPTMNRNDFDRYVIKQPDGSYLLDTSLIPVAIEPSGKQVRYNEWGQQYALR